MSLCDSALSAEFHHGVTLSCTVFKLFARSHLMQLIFSLNAYSTFGTIAIFVYALQLLCMLLCFDLLTSKPLLVVLTCLCSMHGLGVLHSE